LLTTFSLSSARALLADLSRLRAEVADEGATTVASWARSLRRPEFEPAALNLAHYLALRRRDGRDLQRRLSQFGLSSLGQSESRVLPALDAILATLGVVAGQHDFPPRARRVPQPRHSGQAAIRREQMRLFGADPLGPETRIMVTMPAAAASDPALVARMLAAGGDCARINCAHDGPDVWRAIIRHVRAAARAAGRTCPILMDLAGPKVRVVSVTPSGKVRLARGDRFELVTAPRRARDARVQATVSHAEIIAALTPGAVVWIDDGRIGARVVTVAPGRAVMEVAHARDRGERLRAEKGINLPSVDLAIAPLTAKDLADLDFVAAHADGIGYSFVQRPNDVVRLQRELARRRPGRPLLPLILKIETSLAVRNLPRLIVAAGGRQPVAVMIAAAYGEFAGTEGRRAPVELTATCLTRLGPARVNLLSTALGIDLPAHELYLVPVASPEKCVGTLALLDSDGERPDDRLMESYASRAAMAYLHAARLPQGDIACFASQWS